MKKIGAVIFLFFVPLFFIHSLDLSASFGPWTFITEDERLSEGLFPYAGINVGWTDHLESEFFVIAEASPEPFGSLFIGGGLGGPLLGSRDLIYFNMLAQFDFLYGFRFGPTGVEHNRLLGLRLSPLAIGNIYNGYRNRIFTIGAFYNIDNSAFSVTWNLFIFDIFFTDSEL